MLCIPYLNQSVYLSARQPGWRGATANAMAKKKYGGAFRQNKRTGGKAAEESRAF